MTETPEGAGDLQPEPKPDETAEPVRESPAASDTPAAEAAPSTTQQRNRWRWPQNRTNRIAASVAILAGAVAVVAAIFTSGVVVGAHTGEFGKHQHRWGQQSEMSADREHAPTGQILIIPGGAVAGGHDGYIVTGSETSIYSGR